MTPDPLDPHNEAMRRLLEVVSLGVGRIYAPRLIRHKALARAEEIKTVSAAISEVSKGYGLTVAYKEGPVEIQSNPPEPPLKLEDAPLEQRAAERVAYQEQRRQQSIESVTGTAALELMADPTIPEERPDEDWTTRFFSYAQDISSEEMQQLWGRILAGEVRKPGTYSLRTLDLVRNLAKEEAEVFAKVAKLAYEVGKGAWVVFHHDEKWLNTNRDISQFNDINLLVELGLLDVLNQASYTVFSEGRDSALLTLNGRCIVLERGTIAGELQMRVWGLTRIGIDLLPLIDRPFDMEYAEHIGRYVVERGGKATIAQITGETAINDESSSVTFNPLRTVTL